MPKRENSKSHAVEVQKGPIRLDEQYTNNFPREPERAARDLQDNAMRREKMTLTLHIPKQ